MARSEGRDAASEALIEALRQRIKVLEAEAAEHEQTRQLLVEEYSFRKAVIERAAEGLCVCHAIADHPFVRFTVWNPRMTQITGYSMEDINRLGWYQTLYPDAEIQEKASQRMAQMRDGQDLGSEHWEITRADGENRMLSISTSALKTNDGLLHILGLMQDVTDELRYRRHLESRVVELEGLLPICASCKQIRDEAGTWHRVEVYIREHSRADFTHGICPDCRQKLYPGI